MTFLQGWAIFSHILKQSWRKKIRYGKPRWDETFEGVGTSFAVLVSPPLSPPFHPRGLSRRRHFTHVDQLLYGGRKNYHRQNKTPGVGVRPKNQLAWCQSAKERRITCVSLSGLQEEESRRCSVSLLQSPTGYRLNCGRPVRTLRGRRLCPRGCRQLRQVTEDGTCDNFPPFWNQGSPCQKPL